MFAPSSLLEADTHRERAQDGQEGAGQGSEEPEPRTAEETMPCVIASFQFPVLSMLARMPSPA